MKKVKSYSILIIISIVLLCMFTMLFYRQSITYNGEYPSDLPSHIRIANNGAGYSVVYFLISIAYRLFNSSVGVAILESLFVVLSWLFTGKLIQYRMNNINYTKSCLIALPLLFLSGIYIPYLLPSFYSRQIITQSWHNITYFAMRLFTICLLLIFVKLIDSYIYNFKVWQWCGLAVFLALSTASKTNFLLGFAPTLLIFLIADFIKYKFDKKPFIHMIALGTTVFPSLIIMVFQATILYGTSVEEGGTEISVIWGNALLSNGILSLIIRLICNIAFPCLVYIINRTRLDRYDKFVGIMFIIQFIIAAIFTETGARAGDGNFLWGRMIAGYILFISSTTLFLKNLQTLSTEYNWYKIIGGILLIAHVLSGVVYFILILTGHNYLI